MKNYFENMYAHPSALCISAIIVQYRIMPQINNSILCPLKDKTSIHSFFTAPCSCPEYNDLWILNDLCVHFAGTIWAIVCLREYFISVFVSRQQTARMLCKQTSRLTARSARLPNIILFVRLKKPLTLAKKMNLSTIKVFWDAVVRVIWHGINRTSV